MAETRALIDIYKQVSFERWCICVVICFATGMFIALKREKRHEHCLHAGSVVRVLFFSVYLTLILGGTLLSRTAGAEHQIEWTPFWTYREILEHRDSVLLGQVLYNIGIFIPWVFLLPSVLHEKKTLKIVLCGTFALSVTIELLQLVLKCGLCETDDVIHNVLGAAIGYGIWRLLGNARRKVFTSNNQISS